MWFLAVGACLRASCGSIVRVACPLFRGAATDPSRLECTRRSWTLPNCLLAYWPLYQNYSPLAGASALATRSTTSDGRLVRAHSSPRHCIHSFDFLAAKVSPALLILFVNIVLLLKNCISVINPLFVFVSLFVRARCVHFILNVLYFRRKVTLETLLRLCLHWMTQTNFNRGMCSETVKW